MPLYLAISSLGKAIPSIEFTLGHFCFSSIMKNFAILSIKSFRSSPIKTIKFKSFAPAVVFAVIISISGPNIKLLQMVLTCMLEILSFKAWSGVLAIISCFKVFIIVFDTASTSPSMLCFSSHTIGFSLSSLERDKIIYTSSTFNWIAFSISLWTNKRCPGVGGFIRAIVNITVLSFL